MAKKQSLLKQVDNFTHDDVKRKNIPTAEYQSMVGEETQKPIRISYEKRNIDLDPQLIWRGKYAGDDKLNIMAPPLYIQEKIHPKVLIEDLLAQSKKEQVEAPEQLNLFADFNGMPQNVDKTDFYQHEQNWTNRMILGDSLQVMGSLAEREGLRGKVQCIYLDPPYGIKFNSNFQWSTTQRDVKDGKLDHLTREPEQVKAFRDTWRDGIHSYLSYLRDRFIIAKDLLTESGSIFVQIGDENVHRVRAVLDEVFGDDNFVSQIWFRKKTMPLGTKLLEQMGDWIIFYAKNKELVKFNQLLLPSSVEGDNHWNIAIHPDCLNYKMNKDEINNHKLINDDFDIAQLISMSPVGYSENRCFDVILNGRKFSPPHGKSWKTDKLGMQRLLSSTRLISYDDGERLRYLLCHSDNPTTPISTSWGDTSAPSDMHYVVETSIKPIQRCILMTTDPGDLVLDPTCGSGTTAYVAEQWGRRWITIDTSRVALALARARIMGARYAYYLMADSKEGQEKESSLRQLAPATTPTYKNIKLGFVYERVPHITLKSIANNLEIDVIYDKWQKLLAPLNLEFNKLCATNFEEWDMPREADQQWTAQAIKIHAKWWKARIQRQEEIDASISAKADYEFLYDKPYEDKKKVRVAGPFTVESISPHRVIGVGADDELIDPLATKAGEDSQAFVDMILENLKIAGVQQVHKEDKIIFTSLQAWPGEMICAEAIYQEGSGICGVGQLGKFELSDAIRRRAGIFIGPEFGTVSRQDLVLAAREAADADFDILISCAFNYEALASEFDKLGKIPVLKARMNADLHMGEELKNTGKGNLFVVFGEPDISIIPEKDKDGLETGKIMLKVNGVDVFYPNTGKIISDNADGIACWFIDTDYNEESFFVRHAYFLGTKDPYKALKTTLKAEINREVWETLHSDTSRPFDKPKNGSIAVKIINHLGDEVMKVFRV